MTSVKLQEITKLLRYYILRSTTIAGSGHPTSSLSAVELMAGLMFGGFFSADLDNPKSVYNDKLIFSKGHASPLLYSLYTVAGKVSEDQLYTFRQFNSDLEGHPTMNWKYTEAATGSLGQGIGVGVGMALSLKTQKLDSRVYVLLGDSEMAEGSVWESMEIAAHYKLDNLIAIIDVNRLGQRGQTLHGHDLHGIAAKVASFGWNGVIVEDGNDIKQVIDAFEKAKNSDKHQPFAIIAKTMKGAGVSFLEDKEEWHGKTLNEEELEKALSELGNINKSIVSKVSSNNSVKEGQRMQEHIPNYDISSILDDYSDKEKRVSTRQAYGQTLAQLGKFNKDIVVLDAETSNSTKSDKFKKDSADRFFEMYIAEQNMISAGVGFSKTGYIPFCSTFAAFMSRANDQIRMASYSESNIKLVGSHCGVSIGADGSSQMGLSDISMMRSIENSVVLYPSDAVSTANMVKLAYQKNGLVYIRTTRSKTPLIYNNSDKFNIGGSKVIKVSAQDSVAVVAAGITVTEALKAYDILRKDGVYIRVVDLYSIKPIDVETLETSAMETGKIVVVEDHHRQGGLFGAVAEALSSSDNCKIYSLAVTKTPHSGGSSELLRYMEIDAQAIVDKVRELIR